MNPKRLNPKKFTFKDIPSLVTNLSEIHNKWIEEFGLSSFNEKQLQKRELWQMNPGVIISRRYLAMAQILDKAINGVKSDNLNSISNIYTVNLPFPTTINSLLV